MTRRLLAFEVIVSASSAVGLAEDWKPVDPGDLAAQSPRVEKDADAEAMFWEVWVAHEMDGAIPRASMAHYIRVKIFTERGREALSTVDLYSLGDVRITDVSGRTIKPDGTIVPLNKDAVFDKTVVKFGGLRLRSKSFAMPALEPGAITEYRWREVRHDQIADYTRLYFQREVPVRRVTYHIKPLRLPWVPLGMKYITFQCPPTNLVRESDGFQSISYENMPALRDEPYMPPLDEVRAWGLTYYTLSESKSPEEYWKVLGKSLYRDHKSLVKVNDQVRTASAAILGDASTDEEKLARLSAYCRSKIKNIYHPSSGLSAEARQRVKENKSPSDTLKNGMGTGRDINLAFAALATAAGYETRTARVADRGDKFFHRNFANDYFLKAANVAVRVGDNWRFYDPASPYVPVGMLRWQEEDQEALIPDGDRPAFVRTPLAGPEKSVIQRKANLKLGEDGVLEGEVAIEYSGHSSVGEKNSLDDSSDEQRAERLRDEIKGRLGGAELENIRLENVTDPDKPLLCSYHVRVSGYAQRTGKRLFFAPAFFQQGLPATFAASERKYPIYFHYPWTEMDVVTIELPQGFELDSPQAPSSSPLAQVGSYDVRLNPSPDGRTLVYGRRFMWGKGGAIIFPVESYGGIKRLFDFVNRQDSRTLALRVKAGGQ